MDINAMLMIDFYKAVHPMMLPEGITKIVTYGTNRMSRVKIWDKAVVTGISTFCQRYLKDAFDNHFFNLPLAQVKEEYCRIMDNNLGEDAYDFSYIENLHKLGYLPIEVSALPEGTEVPMKVPFVSITNTHPDFAWLVQTIESIISTETWHPMIAATVGHTYRQIVNKYYDLTCDENIPRSRALSNFDFRGDRGLEDAMKIGAAWALSFENSATVPAIPFIEKYYDCNGPILRGLPSTEHSIMCSNYAVDGVEATFIKRILKDIYPNTTFSIVLDSYDYWNIIDNVLPSLKTDILNHNGCMLIRGDSGDCVEVVTKTVFKLWDTFGGTINEKGFKVLDPHIKATYGDSITIERCQKIFEILKENGFACSNVSLGVGSFSFNCVEEEGDFTIKSNDWSMDIPMMTLKPFTRDTFSLAFKSTYCEVNGKPIPIFKNPKEGGFKKSQKGCCIVKKNVQNLTYTDEHTWEEVINSNEHMFECIFRNGVVVKKYSLEEVRDRLNGGQF